jgi:hypothetical protein
MVEGERFWLFPAHTIHYTRLSDSICSIVVSQMSEQNSVLHCPLGGRVQRRLIANHLNTYL